MTEQPEYQQPETTSPLQPQKTGYPNIGQSFLALLILLGVAIAVQLPIMVLGLFLPKSLTSTDMFFFAQSFIVYALVFTITALILLQQKEKKEGVTYKWFRKGNITTGHIVALALLTIFMGIATEPAYKLIPSIEWIDRIILNELKRLIQPNIIAFCIVAILPAIFEETVFRGIMLDGLLKRYSPATSILLSSFLFGLMHMNPMQFVGGIIAGLFLGWVYWKTKSLVACMVIHGVNNALSFFLALQFGIETYLSDLVDSNTYIIMVSASAVLFIAGAWWLSGRWVTPRHGGDE